MPLHVPPAPAPALRSVLAALRSPTSGFGGRLRGAPRPASDSLSPRLPLPIHEMTGVRDPGTMPRTRLTGWRFLLCEPEAADGWRTPVGAAETVLTADGWAFRHFCAGPYVGSTERALREAESVPGDYQPRLLSVPELYMLTLWLHRDAAADAAEGAPAPSDPLIPLAPAPPGIHPHRVHRTDALLPLLSLRFAPAPLLTSPA